MKTLLNGEESVSIYPDDPVIFESSPGATGEAPCLSIGRPSRGWQTRLENIRPNHLSLHTSSAAHDFSFLYWEKQDLLCLAGYKCFFAVRGRTGQIAISLDLDFTDKSSLDFLQLITNSSQDKLLVVSTKLGWLIEGDLEVIKKIKIQGLAESVSLEQDNFNIGYIDTTKIDLPKCILKIR